MHSGENKFLKLSMIQIGIKFMKLIPTFKLKALLTGVCIVYYLNYNHFLATLHIFPINIK